MFAEYNYNLFPLVIVNFSKNIENDSDFDNFLKKWLELYKNKRDFIFIFDTTNVGFPPIKYAIRMSMFIKKLRNQTTHYLKKSFIIVRNNNVLRLLNFIFYLQPPVATVYLTKESKDKIISYINLNTDINTNSNKDSNKDSNIDHKNNTFSNNDITKHLKILSIIKPDKPLLPFL